MSYTGPIFCNSTLVQPDAGFVLENTRTPLTPFYTAACCDIRFAGFYFHIYGSTCEVVSTGGRTILLLVASLSEHQGIKKC